MKSNILIVDDDRQILEHLQQLLVVKGFEVAFVPRGEFLFQRLEKADFDLILLDINLPGKNGIELLKDIRNHPVYHDLPVIMITGEDEGETLATCFELNANDYVRKPINEIALWARVKSALLTKKYQDQKLEIERQKALQSRMMMLTAQMNPHFIFNALNSIQYFIMENDNQSAIHYLSEFSGLMRETLENSMRRYISISEEVTFLNKYLSLEKQRFRDRFNFEIFLEVDEPDDTFLPPMLLQPYVENAIIHGFKQINYQGHINISIKEDGEWISCVIRDNGIGRTASEAMQTTRKNKSIGMGNTKARIDLLNSVHQADEFKTEIIDLEAGGRPKGTEVRLRFPSDLH